MKIKEISIITNVDERTVRRWTKLASDKMSGITDKMSGSTSTHPADFTLEETIEIIRAGGNETLANLLLENSNMKNALIPATLDPCLTNSDEKIIKALTFLHKEILELKKGNKQISAPKEKPVITKNYKLHGYDVSLVTYKNKTYQISDNFYNKHKCDLRYFDKNREWGATIKLGFMSLDHLFKYMERNI